MPEQPLRWNGRRLGSFVQWEMGERLVRANAWMCFVDQSSRAKGTRWQQSFFWRIEYTHTHRGCCVEWRWITTAEPHEGNEGLSTAGPWIYDQHVQALSKQSPDGHGNNGSRKVTQRTIRQMQTQMRWRINNKIEEKCMDLGLSSFNIQVTLESGAATRRHGRWRRSSLV